MLVHGVLTNAAVPLSPELAEAAVTSLVYHHYDPADVEVARADWVLISYNSYSRSLCLTSLVCLTQLLEIAVITQTIRCSTLSATTA